MLLTDAKQQNVRIIFDGQQYHAGENATKNDWKQTGGCDLENKDPNVTECDVLVNSGFE